MNPAIALSIAAFLLLSPIARCEEQSRKRQWLESMIWHHGYSAAEAAAGLEIGEAEALALMARWNVKPETRPADPPRSTVKVLPWAPGRHPRIGFLEGAVDPQRDTKISIFLPWADSGYVVFDLPEAVFSNLGLIYLAHTHVPTLWTERGTTLERIDWTQNADGTLESERMLPNRIGFGAKVVPQADGIAFCYWLFNGTDAMLTGLRNQLCLMLKNAPAFNDQTKENKLLLEDAAAVRSRDGRRWIVTACEGSRTWQNPPVPCIHADPTFPDCPPGGRVEVRGRIFFYDGDDVRGEVERRRKAGSLFSSE